MSYHPDCYDPRVQFAGKNPFLQTNLNRLSSGNNANLTNLEEGKKTLEYFMRENEHYTPSDYIRPQRSDKLALDNADMVISQVHTLKPKEGKYSGSVQLEAGGIILSKALKQEPTPKFKPYQNIPKSDPVSIPKTRDPAMLSSMKTTSVMQSMNRVSKAARPKYEEEEQKDEQPQTPTPSTRRRTTTSPEVCGRSIVAAPIRRPPTPSKERSIGTPAQAQQTLAQAFADEIEEDQVPIEPEYPLGAGEAQSQEVAEVPLPTKSKRKTKPRDPNAPPPKPKKPYEPENLTPGTWSYYLSVLARHPEMKALKHPSKRKVYSAIMQRDRANGVTPTYHNGEPIGPFTLLDAKEERKKKEEDAASHGETLTPES